MENEMIPEEKLTKEKKKFIITFSIWAGVIALIFILTLIYIKRLVVFGSIFSNAGGVVQIIGLVLYLISLIALLGYFIFLLIYILMRRKSHEEWYAEMKHLTNKLDIPCFICKCVSVLLFIFIFLFNPCTVSGSSMVPTFENDDKIIVSSITFGMDDGDVIIFDAKNYVNNESFFIKRIVASEGDKVSYHSDESALYVNGEKEEFQNVSEREYLNIVNKSGLTVETNEYVLEFEVPEDKLLVMGDNRKNSMDSRTFGLIDESDVYGKVVLRFYPFSSFKFF